MKFDIPINLEVHADNEKEAEEYVQAYLKTALLHFGTDYGVYDFEFIEFIPEEEEDDHNCTGQRNNYLQ